jgi:cytochrome b561
VWADGAFLVLAVLRVVWIVASGDPTPDAWRRRWMEVGGLVMVGLILVLLDLIIG